VNSLVDSLVNCLGCRVTRFREDTTFSTGRAQAASGAGLALGAGLILGFAVGGL